MAQNLLFIAMKVNVQAFFVLWFSNPIFVLGTVNQIQLCKDQENVVGNKICSNVDLYDKEQLDFEPKTVQHMHKVTRPILSDFRFQIDNTVDFFGVTDIDSVLSTISVRMEIFLGWVDTRLNVTNSYKNGTK